MPSLDEFLTLKGKNLFNNYEAVIEAGKTYTISATLTSGTRKYIYSYDADGTQIRDLVNWSSGNTGYSTATFTANAGEVKCKYTTAYDQVSELQLELGSTATAYEPYVGEFKTIGGIPGKNKLKPSTGTATAGGVTVASDGTKFHLTGTLTGNYIYVKISGQTLVANTSVNDIKTYNTEPVIIKANETVKFIRKDTTYIRYMYFTTSDGNTTSFAWGESELSHTFTPTTDITAAWMQWSSANPPVTPCDVYMGMFDSTATTYEPYQELDIWQRGIPSQSTKAAAVTVENSRKCVNLFDASTETVGKYINDSGAIVTNASYAYSDFIPVVVGKTYTASLYKISGAPSGALRIHAYDSDGAWQQLIFSGVNLETGTVTIPAGISYVRLSWWKAEYATDRQLNEGSTAQPYYPFFSPTTVAPHIAAYGGTPVRHKAESLWGRYLPIASNDANYPNSVSDGSHGTVAGNKYVLVEWED